MFPPFARLLASEEVWIALPSWFEKAIWRSSSGGWRKATGLDAIGR